MIYLNGVKEVISEYDGFIIDLWGVMHNGKAAFPDALICLEALKKHQKKIIFLSNAPRRLAPAIEKLTELGIVPDLYDAIYTSGEDCYRHLKTRKDPWYACLGNKFYHLGPERDRSIFAGLPLVEVTSMEEAHFLLNTGTLTWDCQVSDYEAILEHALKTSIPMICANPDRIVVHGEQTAICAGAIAERFQALGGDVRYHGKPYSSIYQAVMELMAPISADKILAIGDSLGTDIAGARGAQIDSLLVSSGIHQRDIISNDSGKKMDKRKLEDLVSFYKISPTFVSEKLYY